MAIGKRLREERKRLKMTQAEFADAAQIGVSTLKLYEGGERDPGAICMYELSTIGLDVQYVVTGVRSNVALAADEHILLDGYRDLDAATKKRMLAFVLTESGPVAARKEIQKVSAKQGGQAAGRDINNK